MSRSAIFETASGNPQLDGELRQEQKGELRQKSMEGRARWKPIHYILFVRNN